MALNDRYMVIGDHYTSTPKWYLYEYNGNSWYMINDGSSSGWNNGYHMNKYNYFIVGSNHGNSNPSFIKIYKIVDTNLVHIQDIGSPDGELTSAKHFATNIMCSGKTIVTRNHEFPVK